MDAMTQQLAREALNAQGIEAPGPMLIGRVADAIARVEEGMPGGERHYPIDTGIFVDTPELVDRTEGRIDDNAALSVVEAVLNGALRYVLDDIEPADS